MELNNNINIQIPEKIEKLKQNYIKSMALLNKIIEDLEVHSYDDKSCFACEFIDGTHCIYRSKNDTMECKYKCKYTDEYEKIKKEGIKNDI